jgi:hypothetical protein
MPVNSYWAYGLNIQSDLILPELSVIPIQRSPLK